MVRILNNLDNMELDWLVKLEMLRYDLNVKFDRLSETV